MFKTTKLITIIGAVALLGACGNASTNINQTASTAPEISEISTPENNHVRTVSNTVATAIASGTFSGRSDHITTGKVTLEKTANGYQLNFASDFSLDGAPDPIVAIGNGEVYQATNKISALRNKTGHQVYQLPAGFTPGQFSQVYVWCEKFSVPLGIADLG